jgi:NADH dehydrogenase (ubiquinone) 1 beta subcomplex subunit 9
MRVPTIVEPGTDASAQELIKETELLLEKWKHPDPYRPPTAPGGSLLHLGYISAPAADMAELTEHAGSKYERNLPCPILDRESAYSCSLIVC